MAVQSQPLASNFSLLSTYSNSSSWTRESQSSNSPWDSCSTSTPSQESISENNGFIQDYIPEESHINHTQTLQVTQNPAQVPMEFDDQKNMWPTVTESDISLDCLDDPFMGWENKRTSHNLDNYDWVLSHVENL